MRFGVDLGREKIDGGFRAARDFCGEWFVWIEPICLYGALTR